MWLLVALCRVFRPCLALPNLLDRLPRWIFSNFHLVSSIWKHFYTKFRVILTTFLLIQVAAPVHVSKNWCWNKIRNLSHSNNNPSICTYFTIMLQSQEENYRLHILRSGITVGMGRSIVIIMISLRASVVVSILISRQHSNSSSSSSSSSGGSSCSWWDLNVVITLAGESHPKFKAGW